MKCPSGHDSIETDYCSVCGLAVVGAPPPASVSVGGGTSTATTCPQCSEPKTHADTRFCEVCRYDFAQKNKPISVPKPAQVAPVAPLAPAAPAAAPAVARWELHVLIDPSLDLEPDPTTPPPGDPVRIFPVETAEMLVGRRDDRQQIHPQIPLHDPGASRRHAKILRNADGSISLHDLASANGTRLNGSDVISGSIRALASGDEIAIGRWTRLVVKARP